MSQVDLSRLVENPKEKSIEELQLKGAVIFIKKFGKKSRSVDDTLQFLIEQKLCDESLSAKEGLDILTNNYHFLARSIRYPQTILFDGEYGFKLEPTIHAPEVKGYRVVLCYFPKYEEYDFSERVD